MKQTRPEGFNRPFEALGDKIRVQAAGRAATTPPQPFPKPVPEASGDDEALFCAAMAGVTRIGWNGSEADGLRPNPAESPTPSCAREIEILQQLVDSGLGFNVADTPEYMEGVGCPAPPEITRRLHRGDFSVEAHIDLHGFSAAAAHDAFDAFMQEAVATGKNAVLIIHGRGLSSPALPILKIRVAEWLTTGRWRKWVVAFASARRCDGGSGASYVLLRRRPVPKRLRRGIRSITPTES